MIRLKKSMTRNEHIRKLSREHHFSLLFSWKIRQGLKMGVAVERIRKYVQYFWQQHLQPHFCEEEIIFFTPIKDRMVQRAINEHKQIRQQIEYLPRYSGNDERKSLAKIADMVYEHVRYEERDLFPHLERKLSKGQLENIGEQLEKAHPASLQDQYEDQFWNTR